MTFARWRRCSPSSPLVLLAAALALPACADTEPAGQAASAGSAGTLGVGSAGASGAGARAGSNAGGAAGAGVGGAGVSGSGAGGSGVAGAGAAGSGAGGEGGGGTSAGGSNAGGASGDGGKAGTSSTGAAGDGNAGSNAGGSGPGGGAGAGGSGPIVCPGPLSPSTGPIAAGTVTFTGSDGVVRGVDKTEVTAAQFEPFRMAQGTAPIDGTGACQNAPLTAYGDAACTPDFPVQASFCTARAFCAWSGKALCAASDWTQACRNGGTTTFGSGASLAPGCVSSAVHAVTAATDCRGDAPPFDAVYDMSGNTGEWTDDCVQPPGQPASAQKCRVRGGGAGSAEADLDCASDPNDDRELVGLTQVAGFRCCEPPVCVPGATKACYSGPAGTLGVGLCHAGVSTCLADGTGFGACVGDVVPTTEICATEGDDDCDGATNEDGADCSCTPGTTAPCYAGPPATKGVGDCRGGTQVCNAAGNGYGACSDQIVPQAETCATVGDEDCDGTANEADGIGCVCAPGSTAACYEGPAGTEGVGLCRAGTKTCLPNGSGYGACGGAQVLPAAETCGDHLDESCDGLVDPRGPGQACGGVGFAMSFNGPYSPVEALAVDELGRVIVGGPFHNTLTVAPGISFTAPTGGEAGFLASYDAGGTHIWSRTIPGAAVQIVRVSGGAIVVHHVLVSEPSGLQRLGSAVRRISLSGADVWSAPITATTGHFGIDGVAATSDGGAVIIASFTGPVTLAGTTFQATLDGKTNGVDLLVARFGPTGTALWAKPLTGAQLGPFHGRIGVDATDAVYLAFEGQGSVDLGDTVGGPVPTQDGSVDVCLVKLSATGAHVRSGCFGDGSEQRVSSLVVDAAGNVVLSGSMSGPIDFGLGPLVPESIPGGKGGYLVRFDAAGTPNLSMLLPTSVGLALRGSEIVVADQRGLFALGSDGSPRSAFLPIAPIYSTLRLPAPSGPSDVFVGGWTSPNVKIDVGAGFLPTGDGASTGVWARLPL